MKKREIKLIYNSTYTKDREAYATLSALDGYVVNELDVKHNDMTPTQLAKLANDLHKGVKDLVDTNSQNYDDKLLKMADEDLLETLHQDMSLLKTPIIRKEDSSAIFLTSPYNIYPVDLEINGIKRENNDTNE